MAQLQAEATFPRAPKMTYEEFLAWVPDGVHAEWVDGETIYDMSPVTERHAQISMFLSALMRHWVEARDGGEVLTQPFQMKLPGAKGSGREPDIVFLAEARRDTLRRNRIDGPANVAVEIVSPESRVRDYKIKLAEYEQGGVGEYWLIDPEEEVAFFYRLDESGMYNLVALGEDEIFRSSEMPGVWLKVSWFWQPRLPKLMDVLKMWELV
jgi:Uma2 family endonuclease